MAILLNNDGIWHASWREALARHMPGRPVVDYPDIPDRAAIDYALVWKHPHGDLARYPNLKAIFSLGTGMDHFDGDTNLPDVPIFRLIDPAMAGDMALYALYWTIHFQRMFGTYLAQQRQAKWQRYTTPLAPDFKVTVLGLGTIGSEIAQLLARNGFDVSGWSRSPKILHGVKCLTGAAELSQELATSDVMVCCLPLNHSTRGFLGREILSQLKPGGHVINVSRGAVIDETALLDLLDSDHIAGAALDVFSVEPLPQVSRFWEHPKVYVTPHMSGATNPDTAVQIIAGNIKKFEKDEMPEHRYNPAQT